MKILSETTHSGEYLSYCSLATLFALGFLIVLVAIIWEIILKKRARIPDIIGLLCVGTVTALFSIATYHIVSDGARVTYKATVTDFNVVYEQGYTITGQDGEIYLLEKDSER